MAEIRRYPSDMIKDRQTGELLSATVRRMDNEIAALKTSGGGGGGTGGGGQPIPNLPVYSTSFGEEQNKNQLLYNGTTRIPFGTLNEAPLATNIPVKGIDIGAHFYNDFGLEHTASSSVQANGSHRWYDWGWNHTTTPDYDPSRHPLLGWYQGDNERVLDWQCYWLATAGVNFVIPAHFLEGTSVWNQPAKRDYWVYQMFNKSKNFKLLKYALWLKGADHSWIGNPTVPNAQQEDMIDNIVAKYNNVYTYTEGGKKYPVFYFWDAEGWRGTYDSYNGTTNSVARLKYLAGKLKTLGYDGICIFARSLKVNSGAWSDAVRNDLAANGVKIFGDEYSSLYNNAGETGYAGSYENYSKDAVFPTEDYNIINVLTSASSKFHDSGWTTAGTTPELFRNLLHRAVNTTLNSNKPKVVTIYNVAEWGEAGAALQPNKRDGFGYLDAVRSLAPAPIDNTPPGSGGSGGGWTVPTVNTKEWATAKVIRTVNGGLNGRETTFDFPSLLGLYNYADKAEDYIFHLSITYNDSINARYEDVAALRAFAKPDFGEGRVYVKVYNDSGSDILNVGFNLAIQKRLDIAPPAPTNTAPALSTTYALTTSVQEGTEINIPYTIVDAQDSVVTITYSKDGALTSSSLDTGAQIWAVGTLAVGSHTLSIQAKDSGNLVSNTLLFTVEVTEAPVGGGDPIPDPNTPNNLEVYAWVGGLR